MDDEIITINVREWIVESITTKCPMCGNTYTDTGKSAMDNFSAASITCTKCGFIGEMPV